MAWAMLYLARASSEMAVATRPTSSSSKVAARPIVCGNTVARPLRATPCRASFHQLYSGMPSRGMAGAASSNCAIFSSGVIASSSAAMRSARGSAVSSQGRSVALAGRQVTAIRSVRRNRLMVGFPAVGG